MIARSHALRSVTVLAIALAGGPAAPAAAHAPDPILGGGLYAQNQVLRFDWQPGAVPPAAVRTAVVDAADDSNASRNSKAPTFVFDAAATSYVRYGGAVVCSTAGIACMRRDPASDWFRVDFRPDGHVLDWGALRWCQVSGFVNGCFDVENIMLDELGHVAVLDHHVNFADNSDFLDAVVQTVSRARPAAGWNAHAYGRCDVARLQLEYDVPAWNALYSTCLDLATTITASASPTTVAWDGKTTITAVLKVADIASYDRLKVNPISGRVVVLQRRPVGGSWVDAATMTPAGAAGTYAASITLRSTTEFRAVFRKPGGEGLRASNSGTVKVTVTGGCTGTPCPQVAGGRR